MIDIKIDPVIGPHLIETITSALYEDPIIIFREYVQNSVDAYNMAVDDDRSNVMDDFHVDISIDKKKRNISILDNGYGILYAEFITKMTSIGASTKPKYKNLIGFRGIGRLSAMPSCKRLVFTNKPKGSGKLQYYSWNGDKFHDFLNQGKEPDFKATIEAITNYREEQYSGDANDHYFKVDIIGYKEVISELIDDTDFEERLRILLPLNYSPEFKHQDEIKTKYEEYMGQSLERFSFVVKLDNKILYKPYADKDILESGVVYWELKINSKKKEGLGERIGILWFSFNRKIERKKDEPYGIYVRSKNMLMGDRYSLATAIVRSKSDYVTTPRELSQMLNGVTGEMLIHSTRLNDNARRDWFQVDEESILLRHIIVDFMKRLHVYRYTASRFYRNRKDKDKYVKAYTDLTNFDSEKVISTINSIQNEITADKEDQEVLEYANEDIPSYPITLKRFYERMINCIHLYYKSKGKLEEFIKLKAFIKKDLNKE